MPKREKTGRPAKSAQQGLASCPSIDPAAIDAKIDMLRQEVDQRCSRLADDIEALKLIASPASEELLQLLKLPDMEHLKSLVNNLGGRVDEQERSICSLRAELRSRPDQSKRAACQDCKTDLVRMGVYVHGKKILLEYCPKCVSDPLVMLKD